MKKKFLAMILAFSMAFPNVGMLAGNEVKAAEQETSAAVLQADDGRTVINFNTDWRYKKGDVNGASDAEFEDENWGYVNLPHSTIYYTPENKDAYLGVSWYRKDFTPDESLEGKKLLLTFEAAMQKADVYLNGENICTHEGGYIPFVLDISDKLNYGEANVIAIRIDSRASTDFAPGKDRPDFQYFGGIYGNAYITVTEGIHITDAVEAEETAGGGVFLQTTSVSDGQAKVSAKTQVENETDSAQTVTLVTEFLNTDGSTAATAETAEEVPAGQAYSFTQEITVQNPRLWSVDTPELYTVRSQVKTGGSAIDTVETTFGIRKVEWKRDGLYINDVKMDVEGANLHEETYMFGNAMPDNAIFEEVKRFKENGFDIMRMSHYPHRQAYYDACDKYGVMIVECASGWQYFNDSDAFKNSTYNELRTDIRHKRNHPSIVVWESSLNETGYNHAWAEEMNRIVKEEYPENGVAYAYTAGCYQWDVWDIGLSTPQAGIFGTGSEGAANPNNADKPIIIAEYGDWTYGGSGSTTRVTRESENSTGEKGGDEGMLIQADNIQESVQTNRMLGENWLGAGMYWDYADYAGFDAGKMTYCGVVDVYRIPKYGAYFYRSQKDADIDMSAYGLESGPMVFIANSWDSAADTEVRIFSNCDTVELFLNGESLGEKGHDSTIWGPHGDGDPSQYPASDSGKEISADQLKNAPITFYLDQYEAGELKAIGKIDGKAAAEYVRNTPKTAMAVKLRPESDTAVPLDGSSAKLVWIDIVDENGTVVTDAYMDVDLEVEGPGLIVGDKTITTKGGQLAVWVKSKRGEGDITLTASSENLLSASVTIPTTNVEGLPEVPEGGDSDEYERADEEEQNIFLNKSSRASSENVNAWKNEIKENANDGNDSTKWCASNGSYPQWWEADLGTEYQIETLNLSSETLGSAYHYTIAVSDSPMTDDNYADYIVLDNSKAENADTMISFEDVKGRYVRITFTEATNSEWAVLRDVSGTGTASNLAFGKPVSASSVNYNSSKGFEKAEYAVDGNSDTYWCADAWNAVGEHWLQVDLKDTYRLSQINISFESEEPSYKFVLQGSVDGKHYKDIKDFRGGDWVAARTIDTDEIVQYLRVYDITGNGPWPTVRELEAYGEKVDYTLYSVTREKEAYASSSKEGSEPAHGSNGVPGWYWYPATAGGDEWWYIDTKGIYDLDNIQMTWNAEEDHKYVIDISTDGENWTTVVDRSEGGGNEIRPYASVEGTARYVRLRMTGERATDQGFGLFDAYAPIPSGRKIAKIVSPEGVTAEQGTAFGNLKLPEEVKVELEDGIKTTIPVQWSEEGYSSADAGTYQIHGTFAGLVGVLMGDLTDVVIEVTLTEVEESEKPQLPYNDVIDTDWFYDSVYDVYIKGLMTGLDKSTFGPGNNLVRAHFVTILYRMENEPEVRFEEKFADVKDGLFYSKAVVWAVQNGIVTGYTNTGLFGPNDSITREQMATMMFRYAKYKKLDVSKEKTLDQYPDGSQVNVFAKDAMEWCTAENIIRGKGEEPKILDPQGCTNRAEAATIISRYTDLEQ